MIRAATRPTPRRPEFARRRARCAHGSSAGPPSELHPCASGAARGRTAYLRPEARRSASRLPIERPASPCPACPPPVAPRRLAPSQFSLDINVRNEALGGSRAETSAFEGSGLGWGRPTGVQTERPGARWDESAAHVSVRWAPELRVLGPAVVPRGPRRATGAPRSADGVAGATESAARRVESALTACIERRSRSCIPQRRIALESAAASSEIVRGALPPPSLAPALKICRAESAGVRLGSREGNGL